MTKLIVGLGALLASLVLATALPNGSPVCTITNGGQEIARGMRAAIQSSSAFSLAIAAGPEAGRLSVTVEGPANSIFNGILLYAVSSAQTEIGTWGPFDNRFHTVPGCPSSLTHSSPQFKQPPITFGWTAPAGYHGSVTFEWALVMDNTTGIFLEVPSETVVSL
ncbi:uncharacterized protein BJ171DRAFT_584793 [Polychytrium aggregatum]|uniref:uncharacterized protein n=1 Tax=Polychytrium aggregatum TaxID=110093 RepID=UPI0022FF33FA|nr:uncharacterized protein BJ171DRAFT_584793 [Polychytrium aggregatum]KAI9201895.1 hypothetical protein BJ171DRAFT_584793 [Polychytrium aggregatum]